MQHLSTTIITKRHDCYRSTPLLVSLFLLAQIVHAAPTDDIVTIRQTGNPDATEVTLPMVGGSHGVDWDSSSVTNSEPLGPTVVIDFEGVAPEVDPWVLTGFATYNEDGYALTFPYNFGTAIYDSNHPTANVNGTDVYFFDPSFANTRIEREDGGPFDLLSIDASAQPQGHENIIFQSISLTGYKIPGGVSVVSASFSLSDDWQTFVLSNFTNLLYVEISTTNLVEPLPVIDNLVVGLPAPDILVAPVNGLRTSESGLEATFDVMLSSPPLDNVSVGLNSSDSSEGTVEPSTLLFTPINWNLSQTVTVTGADDAIDDNTQPYTIITSPAISSDGDYDTLDPPDVSVINLDDEYEPTDFFVTTWQTANPGVSGPTEITVPMVGGPYDVDWDNDGIFEQTGVFDTVTHDFTVADTYTIRIQGIYDSIRFNYESDKDKIISLDQWGTNPWTTMNDAFWKASNLQIPATDTPDFSAVTDMSYMFYYASSANPDTTGWNTSAVTNMDSMFRKATSANPNVSSWDTSAVTNMRQVFSYAVSAHPDVSTWDTSNVTDMYGLFQEMSANPNISGWDTSAVTKMMWMFENNTSFDRDIGSWDVTALQFASGMFAGTGLSTTNYDRLLTGWNTQTLKPSVTFSGGNSTYCSTDAIAARANMISTHGWAITDGGNYCPPVPDTPITAPDLTPETDTGVSDTDDFTADNTPDFFVDCSAAGNTITLYSDYPSPDTPIGSYICITDGMEIASATATLPAGVHNITYTDSDVNGESGHSPSLAVTIDTIMASGFE